MNEDLKKIFDEAATHFEQFRIEFHCQTRYYLIGQDKAIIQPAWDYYNNLFHKEGEDCYDMRRMAYATNVSNPKTLKGKSEAEIVPVLHYEANKIMYFNYHHFTPDLIRQLRNEFTKLVA